MSQLNFVDIFKLFMIEKNETLFSIQMIFFASAAWTMLSVYLLASRKSFSDAIAARNIMRRLRIYLFLEYPLNIFLFVMVVNFGAPIPAPSRWTSYGTRSGESWIYGYGRPLCGLLFLAFGGIGDMHAGARQKVRSTGSGLEAA